MSLSISKGMLLSVAIGFIQCNTNTKDNCQFKDYSTSINLDTVGMWTSIANIEVWSFKSYLKNNENVVINNNKPTLRPLEKKRLTKKQTERLKHILYSYKPQKGCEGYDTGYDCIFNPHHAIVFYNAVRKPIAHVEVCFSCYDYRSYGNLGSWGSCHTFYKRLNSLFNSIGIKEYMKMGIEYED